MEVTFPSGSKIKITPKKIREVLGIPMRKKKLESDSPREYDDEFLNAQFHDNNSRLIYYVINNIKSTDIISDFDWCMFIWDHIKTSKNTWDDRILENWYYRPNTVLMLIYLHYTKINGMVMMQHKWPTIRNWTSQDVVDRENFEMSKGQIGLVEDIKDDDKEDENEKDAEKRKIKEKLQKKKKPTKPAEKEAAKKRAAEKEAAAKEKEEAKKIAAAKKKEEAEKLAAAKKKEKAEKL
nr:hypothetical protein [Tanacetum cinerariifolium]